MEFKQVQVLKSVYVESSKGWQFVESDTMYLSCDEYKSFVSRDTIAWFRRLGSKQVLQNSNTSFGRQVTKLSSYAPDNTEKHVYNFRFIN